MLSLKIHGSISIIVCCYNKRKYGLINEKQGLKNVKEIFEKHTRRSDGLMRLYHGSNVEVREPKLIPSKRLLDFGAGFYLTSDFEQARKWALRTTANRESGSPMVSVYVMEENKLNDLNTLTFNKANKEWLKYIAANRTGKNLDKNNYDVVVGPVANDQAIRTVNNYLKGYFSEDIAIQLLLPQKLKDQFVFKTERSLNILRFEEAKMV